MVQFNTHVNYGYDRPGLNDNEYWKLEVVAESTVSAASRYSQKFSRRQRGMLLYDNCSDDELRRFCQQRGLQMLEGHSTREDTIDELERADDCDVCFSRFLDLLPELRLRVYQFYHESLGDSYRPYFAAPPIMSVSKIVRQEVASVFYRERMFLCSLNRNMFQAFQPRRRLYLDDVTRLFFENAPLVFLGNVRRLQVWTSLPEPKLGMNHGGGHAEWLIELRSKARDSRVVFEGIGTYTRARQSQFEQDAIVKIVTERLRDVVDIIVTREPVPSLRREDAKAILAALDTLPEHLAEV